MNVDTLAVMVQITVVMTFAGGVFSYVVLRPLNTAIRNLNELISKMQESQSDIDKRLVRVEESSKSAHHRIDELSNTLHYGRWTE